MATTLILFSVKVPVLSKQITCTEPRFSTAANLRINTLRRCMSLMPIASVVVATAGKPSGTAATASDMVVINSSNKGLPRAKPIIKTSPQIPALTSASCMPMASICFCIGVCGASDSPTSSCILPISVWRPVATTTAVPLPPVTNVPMYTMFKRSARAVSFSPAKAECLATGILSPVSADSSTLNR